jgi:hypothetical protein
VREAEFDGAGFVEAGELGGRVNAVPADGIRVN